MASAHGKAIPDLLRNDLAILFVGINPSLYSAAVGHHFARPGNRFWPALHVAKITPRLLRPDEGRELVEIGCGITNLVRRATARADELSTNELVQGGKQLTRKARKYAPRCIAFVGITAYRAAFTCPQAVIGRQDKEIGESQVWVLPNPSGLNAHYQLPDFGRLFAELHRFTDRNVTE